MTNSALWIAFTGILTKENIRWLRIWPQTLLSPLITISLYFLIFGKVIGHRIGDMQQIPYVVFIAPGLIMLAVITNTYMNVTGSFFGAKFGRSIEEMLVSPMPNWLIILGYTGGGVARGLCTGMLIFLITSFFVGVHIMHPWLALLTLFLCASLFSLAGFLNGIYAKTFDDGVVFLTFLLTPLIYLGGIFYSVDELSGIWHVISSVNPIAYLIALFRYAMLGTGDQAVMWYLVVIVALTMALFALCLRLLNQGIGIRL